ncbi:hypothetical protein DFH09DRAFT_1102722 [Mycena vulgaris]|nr:hypothetical protein DFH09DRAFT_1102722 [Mycena vulgaris]
MDAEKHPPKRHGPKGVLVKVQVQELTKIRFFAPASEKGYIQYLKISGYPTRVVRKPLEKMLFGPTQRDMYTIRQVTARVHGRKNPNENYECQELDSTTFELFKIARLNRDFGLDIKRNALAVLRKWLGVESAKKSKGKRTDVETRQTVIDLKQGDVAGGWGVTSQGPTCECRDIDSELSRFTCSSSAKDSLRQILDDEFGDEFDDRFEEHSDGHEKLSAQGLDIGASIHFSIHASKNQFCSFAHELLLMPNVRKGNAIVHYYLDLVEHRGFKLSVQLTTDMGNEVNEVHKIHEMLRDEVAPELVPPEYPHGVKRSSTNNTPIESFWRWLRDGRATAPKWCYRMTVYWLWVPLIQEGLDNFREYWNNHRLQKSRGKLNASGSSPLNMLINPTSVVATARDCSINVNPETVDRLREAYGGQVARDAAFRFVSREFQAHADAAYVHLGCPEITLLTA